MIDQYSLQTVGSGLVLLFKISPVFCYYNILLFNAERYIHDQAGKINGFYVFPINYLLGYELSGIICNLSPWLKNCSGNYL